MDKSRVEEGSPHDSTDIFFIRSERSGSSLSVGGLHTDKDGVDLGALSEEDAMVSGEGVLSLNEGLLFACSFLNFSSVHS